MSKRDATAYGSRFKAGTTMVAASCRLTGEFFRNHFAGRLPANPWLLSTNAHEAAGALVTRSSLRPDFFWAGLFSKTRTHRAARWRSRALSSPSPRPCGERGYLHGLLCSWREPSPARLRLRFGGRPLPAKAGRGDSKRFARCCLRLGSLKIESGNNSIHVVPDKRATASTDPGSIATDVCCCAKLGYGERFNAPSW